MSKRDSRVLALPAGVRLSDFEWFTDQPPKSTVETPKKKRHRGVSHRGKGATKRHQRKKSERKRLFKKKLKELATLIAFDTLALRCETFQENEKTWREQQAREAKAYAEKLAAAFREAVKKAAAA